MCSREVVCFQCGMNWIFRYYLERNYRICCLVVRASGYRSRGPGSDPWATWFSGTIRKKKSGLENRDYGRRVSAALTTRHPSIEKTGTNFADKRRSLSRYCSLVDQSHGVIILTPPCHMSVAERWNGINGNWTWQTITNSLELSPFQKPPVAQLLSNFTFYEIPGFITVFTRSFHWSLSSARSIQSIPRHPI
jgi:hypothetical protein